MKEIDQFLSEWAVPTFRSRGYRKTGHTFRKQYGPGGDWAVFNFRDYPLGRLGSFTANVAFVPEPLLDWFNFANPNLAMKAPTADWSYWVNPFSPEDDYKWAYDDPAERQDRGQALARKLAEVDDAFDTLLEPNVLLGLVELARRPDRVQLPALPTFGSTLHHPVWRVCLLAGNGTAEDLEAALAECDPYPTLKARRWAAHRLERPTAT